jgi:hypothetical protein
VEIPENVFQAMRDGALAWSKLTALANRSKGVWSADQQAQMTLFAEVLSTTHNALKRLLDANDS